MRHRDNIAQLNILAITFSSTSRNRRGEQLLCHSQIASRQLAPLTRWRKYDDARQALMRGELQRILASGALSSDVYEVVSKSLA